MAKNNKNNSSDSKNTNVSKRLSDFIDAINPSTQNPLDEFKKPDEKSNKKPNDAEGETTGLSGMFTPLGGHKGHDLHVELQIRRWAWKMQQEALAKKRAEDAKKNKNNPPPKNNGPK